MPAKKSKAARVQIRPRIFISHKMPEDGKARASLAKYLKASCDIVDNFDATVPLGQALREAVQASDACVFVATKKSVDSEWCRAELGAFWGSGRPVVIYRPSQSGKVVPQVPPQFGSYLQLSTASEVAAELRAISNSASYVAQITTHQHWSNTGFDATQFQPTTGPAKQYKSGPATLTTFGKDDGRRCRFVHEFAYRSEHAKPRSPWKQLRLSGEGSFTGPLNDGCARILYDILMNDDVIRTGVLWLKTHHARALAHWTYEHDGQFFMGSIDCDEVT